MKTQKILLFSALAMLLVLSSFTSINNPPVDENPVKLTLIYGHPQDPEAFEKYYKNEHARIAEKMTGISRIELTKFESDAVGGKPAHYRMAEFYFPTEEAMEKALATPEAAAALKDLENFASGGVTFLIGNAQKFPSVSQ